MNTIDENFPYIIDILTSQKYPLNNKSIFLVGRSEEAHLTVLDINCSRKQFQIEFSNDRYFLVPVSPNNPTYLDGKAIKEKTPLPNNSTIQAGTCQFRFHEKKDSIESSSQPLGISDQSTIIGKPFSLPDFVPPIGGTILSTPDLLAEITLDKPIVLSGTQFFGRDLSKASICLDHPQVSRIHAQIQKTSGNVIITDLRSANGTFVNGKRIDSPKALELGDRIDIGPYSLQFDGSNLIPASRAGNIEIMAWNLSRVLSSGRVLLDNITFLIKPKEMVALIGPSGSGKTTLLSALSARQPADSGAVFLNKRDLYSNYENLKQDMVLVPQKELLFEQLTVDRMLFYTAKLRLPPDTSEREIKILVDEMLETTKMTHHRSTVISRLSDGQRKRVVLANELLSKPSLIFLDEVTSGLDEQSDKDLMQLFKSLSEGGKTIVCITHSLGQIEATCHLVCILTEGGKLAFLGSPAEALIYFKIPKLGDIYQILSQKEPSFWQEVFLSSIEYQKYIKDRIPQSASIQPINVITRSKSFNEIINENIRQIRILFLRQSECIVSDFKSLAALVAQPILVSLLLLILFQDVGKNITLQSTIDITHLFFLAQISCFWFGCNNASKEIIKDRNMFRRERDFNLGVMSFYLSKLIFFSLVSCCQAFLVLSFMWYFCSPPGSILMICLILFLQAIAGTVLGLAISVYSNTESTAVNLIPLALIPQIILSGLIAAPLKGIALTISKLFVTCYWGYQAMISVIPDKVAADAGISQENTIEIIFILLFHIIAYTIAALTGMYLQERRDIVFIRALILLAEKTKAIGGIK